MSTYTTFDGPWEFDCCDCGAPVSWFVEPPEHRCAACQWLRETTFSSPAEQADMRAYMLQQGLIGRDAADAAASDGARQATDAPGARSFHQS